MYIALYDVDINASNIDVNYWTSPNCILTKAIQATDIYLIHKSDSWTFMGLNLTEIVQTPDVHLTCT